jgi:diguanylate cyclase (GGDEF)-like protein
LEKKRKKLMDKTMQIDRSTLADQMKSVSKAGKKQASFIILGGLDVGSVVTLEKEEIVIGRDPTCDIVLRDDGISRVHTIVRRVGESTMLVIDQGSTNGTFIDGNRIKEATISEGGKLLLGRRTILKFVVQDALEQNYQQQLYESSTCDGLTGVFNRKYFDKKLHADISFSIRHKIPFTLLMIDIDFFKKVNDTYGHRTGDQVLVSVTAAINEIIRTEDVLARYGGEEFAVLAQGTNAKGAKSLGERIRQRVALESVPALDDSGEEIIVTISVGVCTLMPGIKTTPGDVISATDKNLYTAKEQGRNRVIASIIS